MKREIKFRAWDGKNMIPVTNLILTKEKTIACGNLQDETWKQTRIIENNLMQFTGLKDKNGKEIYEGDILKAIDVLLTVWYNDETASFDVLHYGDETGDTESLYSIVEAEIPIEIIGNIYENPELLK